MAHENLERRGDVGRLDRNFGRILQAPSERRDRFFELFVAKEPQDAEDDRAAREAAEGALGHNTGYGIDVNQTARQSEREICRAAADDRGADALKEELVEARIGNA